MDVMFVLRRGVNARYLEPLHPLASKPTGAEHETAGNFEAPVIIRTCEVGCLVVLSNRRRPDEHVHNTMVVETMPGQTRYRKSFLCEILRPF